MTAKLVALYKQPEDPEVFEERYAEHIKLVEEIPGLQDTVLTRVKKTLAGDGFYLMAEMIFEDMDALNSAMRTPEMKATGDDIGEFAGHLMTLMITEEE